MVSAFTHTVSALALRATFPRETLPRGATWAGIACSILPDADVIGFRFGVRYGDFLGHRGFTHSLLFALGLSLVLTTTWARFERRPFSRFALGLYLFLCTASHGFLDALTDGGLGIAFFSPFDSARYFLPWTPVEVSPIGIENFFSARGWSVLQTEILWVWLPCLALVLAVRGLRAETRKHAPGS